MGELCSWRAGLRLGLVAKAPWLVRALQFVRFTHTIFALPFALGSMLVAAGGWPGWRLLALIVLAMVTARTAAMGYNRLADWEIDKRNPRTAGRHRLLSRTSAIALTSVSAAAFVGICAWINPLCFALSPVALGVVFFYSHTKRFTRYAQFFLGLALSVSPVGAWLAVTGQFDWAPCWLALGVLVWVAGFDMIYATQDVEVDRREGLQSMVTWLGVSYALKTARVLHAVAWVLFGVFGWVADLGMIYGVGWMAMGGVLIYEHLQARRLENLEALNQAFFVSNAWVGLIFLVATAMDRWF